MIHAVSVTGSSFAEGDACSLGLAEAEDEADSEAGAVLPVPALFELLPQPATSRTEARAAVNSDNFVFCNWITPDYIG